MATVKALTNHTNAGDAHAEGDVYEVPDEQVENLVAQGMVARTDESAAAPTKEPKPYRRGER
jgi:hypothetical protein